MLDRLSLGLLGLTLFACSSAGPYGYSKTYSPHDDEEDAVANATEYDPIMVQREPDTWKKQKVMLFGIVTSRKEGNGGAAYLTLSMRTLANRNLCDDFDEETCRVTVSDKEHAVVHALAKLKGDDQLGKLSVGAGSLLRVVGKLSDDVDGDDGMPVLEVQYYRHWPRDYFVTSASSSHMRR
jgi:hypothetical protein